MASTARSSPSAPETKMNGRSARSCERISNARSPLKPGIAKSEMAMSQGCVRAWRSWCSESTRSQARLKPSFSRTRRTSSASSSSSSMCSKRKGSCITRSPQNPGTRPGNFFLPCQYAAAGPALTFPGCLPRKISSATAMRKARPEFVTKKSVRPATMSVQAEFDGLVLGAQVTGQLAQDHARDAELGRAAIQRDLADRPVRGDVPLLDDHRRQVIAQHEQVPPGGIGHRRRLAMVLGHGAGDGLAEVPALDQRLADVLVRSAHHLQRGLAVADVLTGQVVAGALARHPQQQRRPYIGHEADVG